MPRKFRRLAFLTSLLGIALAATPASAPKKYDTGATDTEIKIGNLMPYSGPASPYSVIGKTAAAYFKKINAEGGVNGRKITFISYDDAYSPAKAVEQVRKLVEGDEVLLIYNTLGTPPNTAIQGYLNKKRVPGQIKPSFRNARSAGPEIHAPCGHGEWRVHCPAEPRTHRPAIETGVMDSGQPLRGFRNDAGIATLGPHRSRRDVVAAQDEGLR